MHARSPATNHVNSTTLPHTTPNPHHSVHTPSLKQQTQPLPTHQPPTPNPPYISSSTASIPAAPLEARLNVSSSDDSSSRCSWWKASLSSGWTPPTEVITLPTPTAACSDMRQYSSYTSELHLPISLMSCGDTPAASAAVAAPILSECAPNRAGSLPAACMHARTALRTSFTVNDLPSVQQNSGPSSGSPRARPPAQPLYHVPYRIQNRPSPCQHHTRLLTSQHPEVLPLTHQDAQVRVAPADANVTSAGVRCCELSNSSFRESSSANSHPLDSVAKP